MKLDDGSSEKGTIIRSSFLFLTGLGLAAAIAVSTDGLLKFRSHAATSLVEMHSANMLEPLGPRKLTLADQAALKTAWTYIETNTQAITGLVDSVEGFPSTTLWDQGSYLLAVVAANRLKLISDTDLDRRVGELLTSFESLPLFEGRLPNKVYDTRTLAMVDYENSEVVEGIGWSALDIARMLNAFRSLERLKPEYSARIQALLRNWDLGAMAKDGSLWGASREAGETAFLQEGRLGYEQYGARAAALWGLDVVYAASSRPILEWTEVEGVDVPTDLRKAQSFGAITPILSEPFILQAIELGLGGEDRILADRIYRAQEKRFENTGIATMVSEDHVDEAPYFLYSSIFSNGSIWAVVSEDGKSYPELRTLSAKAVFGWDSIYGTEYSQMLRGLIEDTANPEKGWPAGVYESDNRVNEVYTLNTNAIIIEALHFKAFGPLWNVQ